MLWPKPSGPVGTRSGNASKSKPIPCRAVTWSASRKTSSRSGWVTIRRRLQQLMPGTSYVTVTPLREILGEQTRSWELGATMFLAFGALALVLAAIGLYSVMAYNVAQRSQELGVRAALGAQQKDLVKLVLNEGLKMA